MTKEDNQADEASYRFFASAARKAGMSVSAYMEAGGIIGSGLQSRIDRHEVPMSALPAPVQAALVEKTEWANDHPGGDVVKSIIDNGRVRTGEMPRRRPGRPRKHFIKGDVE